MMDIFQVLHINVEFLENKILGYKRIKALARDIIKLISSELKKDELN